MTFLKPATAALCLLPAALFAQDRSSAILVMDGSGSMWGQIDGTAKITIAQEVIGNLMTTLPDTMDLGLTVYGHRRKGDCADIETVVLPGADTRGAITAAVNGIKPKGKTPMADAVVAAAEAMRHTENAATVILVSDGIETCVPDVCAVARTLEETGVDFTAHVVGFDVTDPKALAQFQCMADATGGQFLSASNASELGAALTQVAVVEPEPEPQPQEARVHVLVGDAKQRPAYPVTLRVLDSAGSEIHIEESYDIGLQLLPGDYTAVVLRPKDEATSEAVFKVTEGIRSETELLLPEYTAPATVMAADTAVAGSHVPVEWTGPAEKGDFIAAVDPATNKWITYAYTRDGMPAQLQMPPTEGAYEIRYILADGRKPLASRPITVTPVTATISAPDELVAGSTVPVEWTGPNYKDDFLSVVEPGEDKWINYAYTRDGSPLNLLMPGEPGDYELVYTMSQDRTIIHREPITVGSVAYAVTAPAQANAGSKIAVQWTGPGYDGDYLAVTTPDMAEDKWINYSYMRDGNPLTLEMPGEAGTYEIRYVLDQTNTVQARTTIEVVAVGASVSGPASGPIGSQITATWTGPAGDGDYLTIVTPDAPDGDYGPYAYTRDGTELTLMLPSTPGTYELRYVADSNPLKVLARTPLTVADVPVTITAPTVATAGSSIDVTWTGPGNPRDYLAVGNADSDYITYTYAESGSPLSLQVPEEAGDYEIRYFLDMDNKRLMSVPLRVE